MPLESLTRWRTNLKVALASTISHACRHRFLEGLAGTRRRPLILAYHRLAEDFSEASRTDMASMFVSRAMFERHLEWIGRHFRYVSLDEIGDRAVRGVPFDGPVAAVTFDDGYQDVYDLGFPVLKRMGIPAAVFVVTDLVGRPSWQVHDRLYHLVAKAFTLWPAPGPQLSRLLRELDLPIATLPGYATSSPLAMISALLPQLARADLIRLMDALEARVGNGHTAIPSTLTWPMLETMRRAGFTIGSHTKSHVSLPTESTATAADELEGSKRELETRLGEPIQHFAYPGGHFTTNVVEALARAGYRYGYTACSHYDPRHPALTIERMVMWERTSTDAGGAFCPAVLGCQVHDRWPARCTRVHQA